MSVTPIKNALPGEDFLGIEPPLLQQVDPGWRHRLASFTGRTLSDTALKNEQLYRAGRLALLGQAVTPGIVRGLDLSIDLTAADPVLQVTPGYGISAAGEDATLVRTLQTTLSTVPVVDPVSGNVMKAFKDYAADTANTSYAGVFVLQPILGQLTGPQLDTGTGNLVVSGMMTASCDTDPAEYAFEDWQIVDGVRLVLVAWPSSPATLALPPLAPAATRRNRLAYTVYNAELALAPEDHLPWEMLGVPLALAGFGNNWALSFVDRGSVVRAGGLPRRRFALPSGPGMSLVQPAPAQARIAQLAEQISASSGLTSLASAFTLLPPSGILPAAALDFANKRNKWFPSNWNLTAGPVHQEEIETALLTGMTAAPLDLTKAEPVEILVPLPDEVYDPSILVTEQVAPQFQQEVDKATLARTTVLQHRKIIQVEANALLSALGQPQIDLNAGLTSDELKARDGAAAFTPDPTEAFGTQTVKKVVVSSDIQNLQNLAAAAPYTIKGPGGQNITLLKDDDWKDLTDHGLQHFIDRINLKIKKADDLLDLAFLTSQTDIYRFRQNVLGTTDASRLATSPILANIATGVTAAATAENIRNYLASIKPAAPPPAPAAPAGGAPPSTTPSAGGRTFTKFVSSTALRSAVTRGAATTGSPVLLKSATPAATTLAGAAAARVLGTTVQATTSASLGAAFLKSSAVFTPIQLGTDVPATTTDVTQQSPMVGAELNLRTLTIAERLKQSPAQEGLFYGVGNRLAFFQLLLDLEITVDDLPFLVDSATAPTTTNPSPTETHNILELRDTAKFSTLMAQIEAPRVNTDSDESTLFSSGIRVLEQHSQLLRAIEARIQLYRDFVTACTTALANIQKFLPQAQALLARLENDLAQARQNLAFVTALLADEQQRVKNVNAQRTQVLQNFVKVVVFTRARTLQADANVPSRQLVPGNIPSPVPTCLQQALVVPPELREIVALLREAPINWLPAVQSLLNRLDRPHIFQEIAFNTQIRASVNLQLPLTASSASSASGVYAPVITGIYSSNQQVFRGLQTQRAALQPVQLAQQSWSSQLDIVGSVSAVADLLNTESVHAEVVNATSRIMQQIASVATCLYMRMDLTLPVDRLEWTEYLRGAGRTLQLRSLAVLPGWNSQAYLDRQQMQMLVDWLFQQIDTTNGAAVAFMSDVVRVAILLASHAPVNDVIAGAVAVRTKPVVGGIIPLTLPSQRVAHGMYVQLFSAGILAAQAVVSDLDNARVQATITDVYKPDTFLETTDVAHFTAQSPNAVALRAFTQAGS